jgi:ribonuclease T2
MPRRCGSLIACLFLLFLAPALAQEPRPAPGQFDYYVLSLTWSPQYCADNGGDRDQRQCGAQRHYAFVLHGLWPQDERGLPQSCAAGGTLPRSLVDRMLDVMPSPSLVRHEWATHGTCSGLAAEPYFAAARRAFESVRIPDRFRAPVREVYVSPRTVGTEFVDANPSLPPAGIAVLCSGRYLREVRICLDRHLRSRPCGRDIRSRCRGHEVIVRPLR